MLIQADQLRKALLPIRISIRISQFIEIIIDIDRYGLFQIPKDYEAREDIQFNIA